MLLDDFEEAEIRNTSLTSNEKLWQQYHHQYGGPGDESTSAEQAQHGSRSLKITLYSHDIFMHFRPYPGVGVLNMHDYIQPPTAWKTDYFNRMRFWIMVPPGVEKFGGGTRNGQIGTYCRKSDGNPNDQEDGGGHYYHDFDIGYTGRWHQCIFDTHPTHKRGMSGSYEHGVVDYPTNEPGHWNYLDSLTRFYWTVQPSGDRSGGLWYFDNWECYRDTRDENIEQIYSLHGVYVPATNKVDVGWLRDKNENDVKHEVRYSFYDIHHHGWNSATPAPKGIVDTLGWQGYNAMAYETNMIDIQGHKKLYIGIKPQNSIRFRQIVLPTD